jgi:hypothetical protein
MTARSCRYRLCAAGVAILGLAVPARVAAQAPEPAAPSPFGHLTLGGDATATISPSDTTAFFNYTNYDQNALRAAQFRLMAEWRLSASVSLLGEVRAENVAGLDAAAWYVRWHPWSAEHLDIQVGRIPPVVGLFAREPYGRDNLLLAAPLAYQYLLSLRPDALPASADDLIRMRGRGWEPSFPIGSTTVAPGIPIVSAFRWDTGAEVHWRDGRVDLAGALTRGSAAVPVVGRDVGHGVSWSGRAALDGPGGLTLGLSGSRGPWIQTSTLALVPPGLQGEDTQTLLGADLEYGWGRWLVRAEELRSVFEVPLVSAASPDTHLAVWSGYLESRYRLLPRWQLAGRVEYLSFSSIEGTLNGGAPTSWEAPVKRLSTDLGYRAARQLELRAGWQMNWRSGGRILNRGYPALQLLFWF